MILEKLDKLIINTMETIKTTFKCQLTICKYILLLRKWFVTLQLHSYFLQPRIARKLSALSAVDAEIGVGTYGGRKGQAVLNPMLN